MLNELVIIFVALVLAGFIKGFSGFGTSMILSGMLMIIYDPIHIVPTLAIISITLNILLLLEHKKYLKSYKSNFAFQKETIISLFIGTIVGVLLLKILDTHVIKVIFGIAILIFIYFIKHKVTQHRHKIPHWEANTFLGLITGFFSGLINVNGPPIVLYGLQHHYNKIKMIKSMIVFLIIADLFSITILGYSKLYSLQTIVEYVSFLPFILMGFFVGKFTRTTTTNTNFKKYILAFLILIAADLIIENIGILL